MRNFIAGGPGSRWSTPTSLDELNAEVERRVLEYNISRQRWVTNPKFNRLGSIKLKTEGRRKSTRIEDRRGQRKTPIGNVTAFLSQSLRGLGYLATEIYPARIGTMVDSLTGRLDREAEMAATLRDASALSRKLSRR